MNRSLHPARGRGPGKVSGSAIVNGRGHGRGNRLIHRPAGSAIVNGRHGQGGLHRPADILPDVLNFGLSLVGFRDERQKCSDALNLRRFRAHYGIGPRAVNALISDLKHYQPDKSLDLTCLFMTICWIKLYDTEEVMAGRWGFGEKYIREMVNDYLSRIQDLRPMKINFVDLAPTCNLLPIDTVHIRSQELRSDPNSKWWSHKFNGPGVSFEVVADPIKGKILWINGPEPASIHDITFLRGGKKGDEKNWKRSSLYFHLPLRVKLVGDSAYQGEPYKVTTTMDAHDAATKRLFARMKSMLETCFSRLKNFKVLRESFRHGTLVDDKMKKIKRAFDVAAVLVQYDFENGASLFEV